MLPNVDYKGTLEIQRVFAAVADIEEKRDANSPSLRAQTALGGLLLKGVCRAITPLACRAEG